MQMTRLLNNVFHCDALSLLREMPTESIHSVIADPMYMVAQAKSKSCIYEWGVEPGQGLAEEWWDYHQNIYSECRRVLKPGAKLAWAMGCKFQPWFRSWFGDHRIWGLSRYLSRGRHAFGHIWMVQSREQTPVPPPDDDALIVIKEPGWWRDYHPCPKAEEEMQFFIRHLTLPGHIVLDCFAGTGTTLVAAEQLGRSWIGCDRSRRYCQVALRRLAELCEKSA